MNGGQTMYYLPALESLLRASGLPDKLTIKSLEGKTICVTGTMLGPLRYFDRYDVECLIQALGGFVAKSLTVQVDYLVANNPNSGTSKAKKALERGIPILASDEFCQLAFGA